jgi:molybdopterin/thiamine biosynthesis adenylyltransferase
VDRYARHSVMPWFGTEGQAALRASTAVLVGCGGTGCACASFLGRAGVGRIRIVDPDVVGTTDLHRQVLFVEKDLDGQRPKAEVAAERLRQANSEVEVEAIVGEFNPRTAEPLVAEADLIMDCSDNFETRMLLNEVCTKLSKAWVHGACVGTAGIVVPFPADGIACYRCIVDHVPGPGAQTTCVEAGILGPLAGAVGCLEAAEGMTMLVNPAAVRQCLIYIEVLSHTYRAIEVRKRSDCPVCGRRLYEYLDGITPWEGRGGPCTG